MSDEKKIVKTFEEAKEEVGKFIKAQDGAGGLIAGLLMMGFLAWMAGDGLPISEMVPNSKKQEQKNETDKS